MKHYSISNPEAVYGTNGEGYIVLCDISGNLFMLDGKSGEVKDTRSTGEKITGSPAIFNDMLVVSTESRIYGIKLD
jgi:outer membrane protein assembly factor BamB